MTKRNSGASNNCHHCGKVVAFEPLSSLFYAEHDGQVFTFCSGRCRTVFIEEENLRQNQINRSFSDSQGCY